MLSSAHTVLGSDQICPALNHYDVHLLLRRVLTSNQLGLLTDIVAEAQDLACAVDVQHWWSFSRRLPFPRPSDRPLHSCRHVPALPWQEQRGEVLILVENQSSHSACVRLDLTSRLHCVCDRSTESSSNCLGAV